MTLRSELELEAVNDQGHDPFGENVPLNFRARLHVLGAEFDVRSADAILLSIAREAFDGLPQYRLATDRRRLRLDLVATRDRVPSQMTEVPPSPLLSSGATLLCSHIDAANFAIVNLASRTALVCASPAMLEHSYHLRYELIEFAALTLATRVQSLVPLHAACVGEQQTGLLLMGASGAGKSTVCLHAMNRGMQILSEDGSFVFPGEMRIVGVPNFLHLRPDSLKFLEPGELKSRIAGSPQICRRSGVRKIEVDIRKLGGKLAPSDLALRATVFLSPRSADRHPLLIPLDRKTAIDRLRSEQPYAAASEGWGDFERRIADLPAFELRRGNHPDASVHELRELLRT